MLHPIFMFEGNEMSNNQYIPPPPAPPPIRVIKGDKLVVKDIIEQQKLEKALERSKKKQDDFTRKEFLKDCYKFWKEYKKVEHPYTWWTIFLTLDYFLFENKYFFRWIRFDAPKTYLEGSWFENKWQYEWIGNGLTTSDYLFKRKNQPSQKFIWLNYFD